MPASIEPDRFAPVLQQGLRITPEVAAFHSPAVEQAIIQLTNLLPSQKLWRNGPAGKYCILDLLGASGAIFNGKMISQEFFGLVAPPKSRFSYLFVTSPSLNNHDSRYIYELLSGSITQLRKNGGVVFILEKIGRDIDKTWRLDLIRELQLVDRKVVFKESRSYFLWGCRFPRQTKREPVDLITTFSNSDQWWKRNYIPGIRDAVKEEYSRLGFTVTNTEEIENKLKSSTFVPYDLGSLKLGFGVNLEAICTCVWQIDVNGNHMLIQNCPGFDCKGQPQEIQLDQLFRIYDLKNPQEIDYSPCGDCLVSRIRTCKSSRRSKINPHVYILNVEYSCPSCQDTVTSQVKAYAFQLIGL